MLSIRMQRRGRKGHATYRIVVQDSRISPTSGKVVAQLGHYDPHTKTNTLVKDKAEFYLNHGAQPSDRVAALLKKEGIKLPNWVKDPTKQERTTRNPEKLRKNRPAEEAPAEEPAAEVEDAASSEEAPAEKPDSPAGEETPAEDAAPEANEETAEAEEKPAE